MRDGGKGENPFPWGARLREREAPSGGRTRSVRLIVVSRDGHAPHALALAERALAEDGGKDSHEGKRDEKRHDHREPGT